MVCRPRSGARQLHSHRPRRRQRGRAGGSSFPSRAPRPGPASARAALRPLPTAHALANAGDRFLRRPSGGLLAPQPRCLPIAQLLGSPPSRSAWLCFLPLLPPLLPLLQGEGKGTRRGGGAVLSGSRLDSARRQPTASRTARSVAPATPAPTPSP